MKNKITDKPTVRTDHYRRRNRQGYLSVLLFVLCQLSAAIWLTACTDDIAPADEQTAGSPVQLTVRVAGHVQSRATADNTWDGGEEVGVQLDGKCYKYIADANGKLTVAPGEEIPRWSGSGDKKTVVAWYPYSDKLPETFTMEKGQSTDENYYKSDFLLAKETEVAFGNPEITFRHLPAKVVVNVKIGDGVTEADVSDLSKLKVSIHNHFSDEWGAKTYTSGKINPTDGTVEPLPDRTREDSLYMNALPRPASGFIKSFRALLVPQVLTKGVPFLKVYKIQGGWFYYTPQSDGELSLEPGKKYVYNITVMKDGLSVVRYEDGEWDTEEKDIYRKEPQKGYRAQDLKPFDYYYSDGTWSDGGYRRYSDGTEGWLDIAPTEGKKVIGIVFQADKNRMSQAEKSKGWEHGYAVAVTVCAERPWPGTNEWEWGVRGSNISIEKDVLTTFIDCKKFIFGYEATQKVIYEVGKGEVEALKDTKYEAFYQACQYGKTDYTKSYAAPEKSSGWYLPSVGQWWDIMENLFGCKLEAPAGASGGSAYRGQDKPYVKKNIRTQLNWIPGAQNFTYLYWTSSIYDKDYAWYVGFEEKNAEFVAKKDTISLSRGNKETTCRVRAVIAF